MKGKGREAAKNALSSLIGINVINLVGINYKVKFRLHLVCGMTISLKKKKNSFY
jgi:hypothetical protein